MMSLDFDQFQAQSDAELLLEELRSLTEDQIRSALQELGFLGTDKQVDLMKRFIANARVLDGDICAPLIDTYSANCYLYADERNAYQWFACKRIKDFVKRGAFNIAQKVNPDTGRLRKYLCLTDTAIEVLTSPNF